MTGSLGAKGFDMFILRHLRILVPLLVLSNSIPLYAADVALRSQKHAITIYVRVPPGWEGGYLKIWPSYETWSFARTDGENISYLQVRIDPVTPKELDWNLATNEEIKKTFYDFTDPEIERIAETAIENVRVLVWAALNVDGQLLMAKVRRGKVKVSFELRTERRAELRRFQKDFLDVLKNVRIR